MALASVIIASVLFMKLRKPAETEEVTWMSGKLFLHSTNTVWKAFWNFLIWIIEQAPKQNIHTQMHKRMIVMEMMVPNERYLTYSLSGKVSS